MGRMYRLGLVLMGVAGATAQAASIGVNFYGDPAHVLAPDDVAGVSEVAQANWNNMTISNGDGNGRWNGGSLFDPVDDTGTPVTGLTIHVGAYQDESGTWHVNPSQVWHAGGGDWGFTGADGQLHRGELRPSPRIVITGIPYEQYDIYAYAGGNGTAGGAGGNAYLLADSEGVVDTTEYNWRLTYAPNQQYVRAIDSTLGNYVRFENNTASDVTLIWNPDPAQTSWEGIVAFQIVAVPEPACISAIAAASLFVLRRRRARQ